jgi:PAS domain S-box-containing protein
MKDSIIIGLLQNTAILLAFAMLYENLWIKSENSKSTGAKILIGLFLSGIGVLIMFTPWIWVPGVVFDARSVMISVSGLFFGPIPTIIVMSVTGIVRLFIGGDGQLMGLAVIISSGTIGSLWRKYRTNWKTKNYYLELLAMGLLVHITMSACTFLLPPDKILPTLKIIVIPLIFIYSPATMLLGIVMLKQYNNWQNRFAQLRLQESERRLTQVLDSGNILSLFLNKDGSINFCNNYLLQVTGYSQEEILGKNWFELFIPGDTKQEMLRVFSDCMNTNNIVKNYENKIISKSGEQLYISWYNIILQSDTNEVLGMATIGVDITKSKIYENELKEKNAEIESQNEEYKQINQKLKKAKAKAEESDRLKSAFLANMSHEIRTPMNGILGFAGLLKEPDLTGEEQENYIRIIEKSGVRMLNIINDIIDISKIESGQMEVAVSETNIIQQIEYIYVFFKPEVEAKGMRLIIKNSLPDKEFIIKTDKEKIFAILTNLVKNAIKYSDHGTIELGCRLLSPAGPLTELEFFVKDTGIGIPKNRQKAIFDRFVQADIADTRAYQGAGLGLSISKAYVEMLGGKIWVESKEGVGSEFYFTIPSIAKPEENTVTKNLAPKEVHKHKIKPLKILLVEDDESSAMLIKIAVEKFSKVFLNTKTGDDAVEICRNNPDIDLVLMDIKMSVMDGYEATRQIRQFNKSIIIIAQTAYGLGGDREKAIESGCNEYLSKPINTDELLTLIQKYFKK